ncbi:hypothetical protein V1286_007683 [Bradyrhizobium algeriense]|uniref:ASCH domain-containing protein n=1 Tax=Bradyrhizobium algeriense TaxID=634784 RepID=A0ABU8BPW4_9BRAD
MKGLIIDEPWISLILAGEKIWEMRKTACHHRGRIALIRKGSGQVVGIANVVGSLAPLSSPLAYADAEPKHRIPPDRQDQAFVDGWRTPWVLVNARPLTSPVPYKHPFGAVIWVNLDVDVVGAVEAKSSLVGAGQKIAADRKFVRLDDDKKASGLSLLGRLSSWLHKDAVEPVEATQGSQTVGQPLSEESEISRIVKVTGGNLRNDHLYLPLDFFPTDAIGGRNRSEAASRMISVTFTPGATVETDIDRAKRILRERGAVADFFARAGVKEGDSLRLTNTAPYRYEVSKVANA